MQKRDDPGFGRADLVWSKKHRSFPNMESLQVRATILNIPYLDETKVKSQHYVWFYVWLEQWFSNSSARYPPIKVHNFL